MRLFVAVDLPEDIKNRMQKLTQPVRGVRWQDPDQYHLTLRFIGKTTSAVRERVEDELLSVDAPSFEMELEGTGRFPEKGYPRVIWVGVRENEQLYELQEKIEHACRRAGIEPENRPFKAHITLGKASGASKEEVLSFIEDHRQFGTEKIPVDEFVLYQSILGSDGAVHKPVRTMPLDEKA